MATMRLEIVTAEREVYSDDVSVVVAPGMQGELAILPHHAPLMTTIRPGELRVEKDGQETYMSITGGFLEVLDNKVTILADAAERAEEIDIQRAEEAMRQAQERLSSRTADVDLEQAMTALRRAQVRVGVARRRRTTGRGAPPAPQA